MTSQLTPSRYDLGQPDLYLHPYPLLDRMRNTDPVYWSAELESWVVTPYDEVAAALRDPRLSVVEEYKRVDSLPPAEQLRLAPLRWVFSEWGGRSDPVRHTAFNGVMKRQFTPQRVAAVAPVIQAILDDLLAAAGEPVDVPVELAHPLAMRVVMHMLGAQVDAAAVDRLVHASEKIAGLLELGELEQLHRSQEGMLEVAEYLMPTIAARRAAGGGADLLGVLAGPEGAELGYTDRQIAAQGVMFVVVGYHTTANMLSNGLQLLLDHDDQRAALAADLTLLPGAIQEMMRYHGPVSTIRRMALEDLEIAGQPISEGDTVVLALLAANRDPAVFEDPDRFWIQRPNVARQLGFTVGPYSCMGQALARMEAQTFFTTLLTRYPGLAAAEPPQWTVFRPLGKELLHQRVRLQEVG